MITFILSLEIHVLELESLILNLDNDIPLSMALSQFATANCDNAMKSVIFIYYVWPDRKSHVRAF